MNSKVLINNKNIDNINIFLKNSNINFIYIVELNCSNNNIKKLINIQKMINLKIIIINNNKINSFEEIQKINEKIININLTNNPIIKYDLDWYKKIRNNFKKLKIYNNIKIESYVLFKNNFKLNNFFLYNLGKLYFYSKKIDKTDNYSLILFKKTFLNFLKFDQFFIKLLDYNYKKQIKIMNFLNDIVINIENDINADINKFYYYIFKKMLNNIKSLKKILYFNLNSRTFNNKINYNKEILDRNPIKILFMEYLYQLDNKNYFNKENNLNFSLFLNNGINMKFFQIIFYNLIIKIKNQFTNNYNLNMQLLLSLDKLKINNNFNKIKWTKIIKKPYSLDFKITSKTKYKYNNIKYYITFLNLAIITNIKPQNIHNLKFLWCNYSFIKYNFYLANYYKILNINKLIYKKMFWKIFNDFFIKKYKINCWKLISHNLNRKLKILFFFMKFKYKSRKLNNSKSVLKIIKINKNI